MTESEESSSMAAEMKDKEIIFNNVNEKFYDEVKSGINSGAPQGTGHSHTVSSPENPHNRNNSNYDSPKMKQNYQGEALSNNIKTLKQSINSKHQGSESMLESLEVMDPVHPYENV